MKWEEIFKTYLVETLEFIKSGKDSAITQGQLYLQELIKWEILSSLINSVVSVAVVAVCVLAVKNIKKGREEEELSSDEVGLCMFLYIVILGFSISSIVCAKDSLKAYTSPRLVIIEKLQDMVK